MVPVNPFRNLIINLHAKGPAAVMIVWIVGVTTVGMFGGWLGSQASAATALTFLGVLGGALIGGLLSKFE